MLTNQKRSAAYTIVELLVGIALGIIIVSSVIQIYLSTRATSTTTQNLNRIQEDLRFATYFINTDLRETSNLDCLRNIRDLSNSITDLNNLNIRVGGWNFDGTSSNDTFDQPTSYSIGTNRSDWVGLNNGTNTNLPNGINSLALSDVLAIKTIRPVSGVLVNPTTTGTGATQGLQTVAIAGYTPVAGENLIVGNCFTASRFIASNISTLAGGFVEVAPSSGRLFLTNWDESSSVYSVSTTYYYVGLRAGAVTPSLFRLSSIPNSQPEELVEGIENLQLAFGVDTDGDTVANRYSSADEVTNWEQVSNVRLGLSLVIPNGRTSSPITATETFTLADNVTLDPIDDDQTLRFISNTTTRTRNLGLPETHNVCLASDTSPANATCNSIGYVRTSP